MMLPEVSNSGEAAAAATDHGSSGFSEDEKGRTDDARTSGGNRWPRQETLYLLKIRQDMDAAFRDSSLKAPLWEEVSRKLASLGFHRSAKKCKEKFENVYKYHKRIKEGRSSKSDGKTYKFFDQLEALEATTVAAAGHHHHSPPPPPQVQSVSTVVTPVDPISVAAPAVAMPAMNVNPVGRFTFSQVNSSDSGSSTSSDDEVPPAEGRRSRKRKWEEFFGRLMKQVVEKQEELQVKFIEALERRERDRIAREEAWRMQEMAKMKREHDLLVQERSIVAAKDAAVIAFLQKIADQNPAAVIPQIPAMQLLQQQQQNHPQVAVAVAAPPLPPQPTPPMQQQPQPQPQPQPLSQPSPPPQPHQAPPALSVVAPMVPVSVPAPAPTPLAVKSHDNGGGGDTVLQPSPSRWPKAEINALIQIRTSLDTKYQEGGPKGPLWEEVSAAMRNLGYNRNAKRCKEKWENINKYYKKVKESSKKRPEDSKTCPYFHQLDAIYREKANASSNSNSNSNNNNNLGLSIKPESQMAPIMARPEQQWPLPSMIQEQHHQYQQQLQHQQQPQQQQQQSKMNEPKGIKDHQNADLNSDDYDDDDDDDEEEGGDYEIVQSKTSSMAAV